MDKVMMFLVQKSVSGAVDNCQDESSRARHSVSIELLDNEGTIIPDSVEVGLVGEAVKNVGEKYDNVTLRRKRHRVDDGGSRVPSVGADAVGDGVNGTLTILGGNRVIMNPMVNSRSSKEGIGVSIQPHKRWAGGATVPLIALQIFNLPQHSSAYLGRARTDLVDRCLGRAVRVSLSLLLCLFNFDFIFLCFNFELVYYLYFFSSCLIWCTCLRNTMLMKMP